MNKIGIANKIGAARTGSERVNKIVPDYQNRSKYEQNRGKYEQNRGREQNSTREQNRSCTNVQDLRTARYSKFLPRMYTSIDLYFSNCNSYGLYSLAMCSEDKCMMYRLTCCCSCR